MTTIINTVAQPVAQVIFAHGAGADMQHDFMSQITRLFNQADINVWRFNFPYMDRRAETGKRYPPDRMPTLLASFKTLVEEVVASEPSLPLFIGGKSMGSRVAATLANDEAIVPLIQGVFCLGYPFHPAKKPEKLRLEPLQATQKPILIVQGERDTLGNQQEVLAYNVSNLCQYAFLADGDHSLKPRVKSGYTQQQHLQSAVHNINTFIKKLIE